MLPSKGRWISLTGHWLGQAEQCMTYHGSQLKQVTDSADLNIALSPVALNFIDGVNLAEEYKYDKSGNLIQDLNKGIEQIKYNSLNLPDTVIVDKKHCIYYRYGGEGSKFQVIHKDSVENVTDYCGNVIYDNDVLHKVLTEEGFVTFENQVLIYHYFLQDHQGNNRMVIRQDGTKEEVNHYYPFGGLFGESKGMQKQAYKYNGKELDTNIGLNWHDYGARHYDAALGRWNAVDPMAEKYYGVSPYNYCGNNPILHIDPDGTFVSPYYTENGKLLGVDEKGFTGNIYITNKENFDKFSKNGIVNSKEIQGDKNTNLMKDKLLTSAAESHIYTDVLKKSRDTKLDMSQLFNGEISIVENVVKRNDEFIGKGYNNPAGHTYGPKYNQSYVDGEIRVTVEQGSNQHDLYTVESIQNYLGVHEYYGHGIMKWSTKKTHWKCYNAQLNHPTFKKLPKYQQNEIRQRNYEFYINRNH